MIKYRTQNEESVKKILNGAYIVIFSTFALFLILATLAYKSELKLVEYTKTISRHYYLPRKMEFLLSKLKDFELGTRGFLSTRDSSFLEPQVKAEKDVDVTIDELNDYHLKGVITIDDMKRIRSLSYGLIKHQKLQIDAPESKRVFVMKQGKLKMDSIRIMFDSLRDISVNTTAKTRASQEALVNQNPYFLLVIIVVALSAFAIAGFFIIKFIRSLIKTQIELSDKITQLNQTNRELDEYAFTLTHYMQEPLRKIRLFISRFESKNKELLTEGEVKEKAFLTKAQESAEKAQLYLDEFLSYSRLIKQSNVEKTNVDLNEVVEETLREHSAEIKQINPKIEIDVLPFVFGNKEQLKLMFWHLIDNSLKYRNTRRRLKISIDAVFDEQNAHIKVIDNGIGFGKEYNETIFEIFKRLHHNDELKGLGVGLSICKKIVESHKGTITAIGIPNEGATFDIILPNPSEKIDIG